MTAPAAILAHLGAVPPNTTNALALVRAFRVGYWLRDDQRPPPGDWRSWGLIAGRGFGKTRGIAVELNARVETGASTCPALMAPNLYRVRDVQIAALIETSPPWFRAEPYKDGVRWPNGVVAEVYTPEAPGRSRSGNFDFVWLTEIVDWLHTTRREAFDNITTACRVGAHPQYVWDTTSKGKNDVIQFLFAQHEGDPQAHRIVRGTMFDNPFLERAYLRDTVRKYVRGSRRYREEVLGEVFAESAGALWQQSWIDDARVAFEPENLALVIVGCDPALSDQPDADETGIITAGRDTRGECYVLRDRTGRHSPERWGDIIVEECARGAAGVVIERNHIGDNARANIRARAKERGMRVEVIPHGVRRPFPARVPGTIVVREIVSRATKGTRAHPVASLTESGHVHHVGQLEKLELQLTTWEPDAPGRSPNGLDAYCEAINELAETLIDKPGPRPGVVQDAAKAQGVLRDKLRRFGGARRLGI